MDTSQDLLDALVFGAAHCQAVIVDHGSLLVTLFIAGLVGSAGHCVGMCGPFVLGQVVARLDTVPAARMTEWHRLQGAALTPYHLGRATTYTGLGAGAAALAGGFVDLTGLKWVSAALLALAAVFFAGYALSRLGAITVRVEARGTGWWEHQVGRRIRPLFARPLGWRGYALGLSLGFLPCGLLYGAIAAAAASGTALAGAFAMAAFAIGTVPVLVAVGLAGHVAGGRFRTATARLMPFLLMVNAGILGVLAWRMVA